MPQTPDSTEPESDNGIFDRIDDLKERLEEAAIQAEFETGEREETVEEAKSHALVRIARMTLGFIVVIIGIIALPLPGPGWLIIAGGLTILSKDVAWADRLLRYIRKRVPGVPEDGKIPRSSLVTMALITLAFVSASLWWTFGRGSEDIQAGNYTVTQVFEPTTSVPVADPDIEIGITEAGPILVTGPGCEPVTIAVSDRTKSGFILGDAEGNCSDALTSRVVDEITNETLNFGYSTDGIVEWFFADDQLTEMTDDSDAGFSLTVEPG